jgi:shikimate dehydrogenase
LGAGGAGRAAALKLASEGVAALYLVNRTAERAGALAGELRARFPKVQVEVGYPASGDAVGLILNATSLGLKPGDASPLDAGKFSLSKANAVYDMIYRPPETGLLRAAAMRVAGWPTAWVCCFTKELLHCSFGPGKIRR